MRLFGVPFNTIKYEMVVGVGMGRLDPFYALDDGVWLWRRFLCALSLLRALNIGYHVGPTRNALRAPRNRAITCLLRERNRLLGT